MKAGERYDSLSKHVISTLCYFDLFDYPLKADEVYRFLPSNHTTAESIHEKLLHLCDQGTVHRFGDFFSLKPDAALVQRRLKGNEAARAWMQKARQQAALIQRFPFVRSVMISGSLSKGYMDEFCDLDFFIVTARGRLWIARMLLVGYKRLFLHGSHKYFCINYFIDEDHLTIEEKNIYTATELVTLIPLTGQGYFSRLIGANPWVFRFLPNCRVSSQATMEAKPGGSAQWFERLINLFFPSLWNSLFMKMTYLRWKWMYAKQMPRRDFELAFKTRSDVSKNHPRQFQKNVLLLHQKRLAEFLDANPAVI